MSRRALFSGGGVCAKAAIVVTSTTQATRTHRRLRAPVTRKVFMGILLLESTPLSSDVLLLPGPHLAPGRVEQAFVVPLEQLPAGFRGEPGEQRPVHLIHLQILLLAGGSHLITAEQ